MASVSEIPTVPKDPSISMDFPNEKRESIPPSDIEEETMKTFDDHDVSKPFPIDPSAPEETHQLTVRALIVGSCLGAVVGASNVYLGLKTGFTFGPQLFGALFGYVILKAISKALPESGLLGWMFGGPFGPKENCTVQSAATAAGGMSGLFVSAFPAMYRLGLLSPLPQQDVGKLIALTICSAFFGVFFVIPLRKYYIVHQKLTFPTPAATAYTIRSLHSGIQGAQLAKKKGKALLYTFVVCFVYKVVSGYAPGVIFDWHVGWTLYRLGFTSIISLENYGWWIEFTPAFVGAGMLSGLNASWSFMLGAVLSWGVIAPSLIRNGLAVGVPASDEFPLISYQSLSFTDDVSEYINSPSPRYWLLWPGVLMMLLYSFTDIFLSLLPIFNSMRGSLVEEIKGLFRRGEVKPEDEDQTPMEDRVPTAWWSIGLLLVTIMSCAILATSFPLNVGEAILALIVGFLFSFIGVQSSGATDINPTGTVAKASQLVFGGIAKGQAMSIGSARMFNLTAGTIASGSAGQSSDMTGDLKTGYLLRAKPKAQFIAQLCGSLVSVFLSVGLFILFTKASPCIMSVLPLFGSFTALHNAFKTLKNFSFLQHFFIPKKYWIYVPNFNAVGLAFVTPQVFYPLAMAVGSVINYYWQKRNPKNHDIYMFAVSAGLLAGEGLGGVFNALLAVIGVDGGKFGTAIGCPGFEFCG
ncbi:hypothetical protein V5O48_005579 [Marasmius crinis-equi]|uniref:Oligopeptide transporter n=1 Tax=Marasmius crinis-equi TaxID=585013 RepID=A0ABR3FM15_9AGAR